MGAVVRGKIQKGDCLNWDGKTLTGSRIDATSGTITGLVTDYEVDVLAVFGNSTAYTVGTITDALQHIGTSNVTLVFAPGTWDITDDVTIPSNFTCRIPAGCVFDVTTAKTLTFQGPTFVHSETATSGAGTVVGLSSRLLNAYYPTNAAETSASATIKDYGYFYGDIRRCGAATATADNSTAIQDTINAAAHGGWRIKIPGSNGTRYQHATTLYTYYSAGNNPNFPSGARQDGRLIIEGDSAPFSKNFQNTEYRGSILEYTASSGIALDVYDSSGTEARNVTLRNFGIYANTSGVPLSIKYCPTVHVEDVFVGNNGTGGCVYIEDSWSSEFIRMKTFGDGTNGTAIAYVANEAGGGLSRFESCVAGGCDIGWDLGTAYNASLTGFVKEFIFKACESGSNVSRNWRIRHGFADAVFEDCWSEFADPGATAVNVEISNYAGIDGIEGSKDPGLIEFRGGRFSATGTVTAGFNMFEIGDDTATSTTDAVGNVKLHGVSWGRTATASDAIRRHNDAANGYLQLDNLIFANNGGDLLVIDDEAQYGPIHMRNWDTDGITKGNWVQNTASDTTLGHWIASSNQLIPHLTSGTYDYSNATYMPSLMCNTTSADITLTLPTAPQDFECTLFKGDNTNDLILDPGAVNLNESTTDLTLSAQYSAIKLAFENNRKYVAAFMVSPRTSAYTTGAHTTLRDFTGTTTAAEALKLIETLVEDLKLAGIVP